MVHGLIHSPLDAVESSCTLGRETAPKHNVSTSMLDGGDGVLGVIFSMLPPPNAASRVDAKELDFGLICPHPVSHSSLESFKCSLANFRQPCTCASLSRGTLRVLQYFKPLRRSVLPIVFLVTVVPAALRSFPNFRQPCTCASLSRGTLRVLQYFKPLRRSVLPIVFLVTVVPAALRSFT